MKKNSIFFILIPIFCLLLFGCGEKQALLKVLNQNDGPITQVKVEIPGRTNEDIFQDLNITKGNSQVFVLNIWADDVGTNVDINYQGGYARGSVRFSGGKTTTITLTDDGSIK